MADSGKGAGVHDGACFCGSVKLQLRGEGVDPMFRAACHCSMCRLYHGAPFTVAIGFPITADSVGTDHVGPFHVTSGLEHVGHIDKIGKLTRWFCRKCGTPLLSYGVGYGFVDAQPYLYPTLPFDYDVHIWYKYRAMDVVDGKPKLADLPPALGGSGASEPEVRAK